MTEGASGLDASSAAPDRAAAAGRRPDHPLSLVAADPPRPPRVAVALGGGGARGYAHIGVLEVLEERGYEVVGIAGSSMGALIGGLHAAGGLGAYSAWVRGLSQRDVLRLLDPAPRAPGAIRAEKILAQVSEIVGDVRIEDLPLPFTAVATDLQAGEELWLQDGPLAAAIRASIALPGFMTPVVLNGRLLADGGLMNPLPIAPTLAVQSDVTVAVAVSGPQRPLGDPATAGEDHGDIRRRGAAHVLDSEILRSMAARVATLRRTVPGKDPEALAEELPPPMFEALPPGLRMHDVVELSLAALQTAVLRHTLAAHPPDLLITVPKSACRTLDFHRAEELIGLGRRLAADALDSTGGRPPADAPLSAS